MEQYGSSPPAATYHLAEVTMGYYWGYYLVFILASVLFQHPILLVGVVAFFLLRRFIPDPVVLFRTFGRIQALRRQIDANPANVTARRDLATVYLQRLRPGAALTLLDGARKRFPDDPELLYLTGLAHSKRGEHEQALGPLVRAIEIDPKVRFGEPFLVAGDALRALGRSEEAVDAYERYVKSNSSSIEGHLKLSMALDDAKDAEGARKAREEALSTWRQLPGFQRRKQVGWWLRAWTRRLTGF